MSSKHLRGDLNYAWPSAEIAVMGAKVSSLCCMLACVLCSTVQGGVTILHKGKSGEGKVTCYLGLVLAWVVTTYVTNDHNDQ